MFGLALLFVYVFLLSFWHFDHLAWGKRELVFVLIVHLFVSYAHVNLCHFFSRGWLRLLVVALPGLFYLHFYNKWPVTKGSCWYKNFDCPSPCPGDIYICKIINAAKRDLSGTGSKWVLKCCQNLYQEVVCPCNGAIYMIEIVKKCKISLPAQDQLSGEHCKTVGPLVTIFSQIWLTVFIEFLF